MAYGQCLFTIVFGRPILARLMRMSGNSTALHQSRLKIRPTTVISDSQTEAVNADQFTGLSTVQKRWHYALQNAVAASSSHATLWLFG